MKKLTLILVLMFSAHTATANWEQRCTTDDFDGKFSCTALSPRTTDIRNTVNHESWLRIGCTKDGMNASYNFNYVPKILGDKKHDGFSSRNYRIKWDSNKPEGVELLQLWGGIFLLIPSAKANAWIANAKTKTTHILEVPFYGNKIARFKYSLAGSTEAINSTLKKCGL